MEIICLTQPAARLEHPSLYNLRCSKRIPVTNAADVKREILQLLLKVWEPRPGCQRSRSSVQQESAGAPQPGRSGLLIPVRHHQSLPLTSQGSGQVLSWFLLWTEGSVQAWKCLPVLLGNRSLAQLSHSEAQAEYPGYDPMAFTEGLAVRRWLCATGAQLPGSTCACCQGFQQQCRLGLIPAWKPGWKPASFSSPSTFAQLSFFLSKSYSSYLARGKGLSGLFHQPLNIL